MFLQRLLGGEHRFAPLKSALDFIICMCLEMIVVSSFKHEPLVTLCTVIPIVMFMNFINMPLQIGAIALSSLQTVHM